MFLLMSVCPWRRGHVWTAIHGGMHPCVGEGGGVRGVGGACVDGGVHADGGCV